MDSRSSPLKEETFNLTRTDKVVRSLVTVIRLHKFIRLQ